jgi:hypothetical protein
LPAVIDSGAMSVEVIAIFDVGKTNKKFLLFDSGLNMVHGEEKIFDEIYDDDGFACEDNEAIEAWRRSCLTAVFKGGKYIINADIEIHDISTSLVPYLKGTKEQFILVSTGKWCIFINPFNAGPLTAEQLRNDTLYYLRVNQKQVKSSRFFLGHIHDKNVERLNEYFGVPDELYKTIKIRDIKIWKLLLNKQGRIFFRNGIPADYVDNEVDMSQFLTFADAYHQMMFDLVDVGMESLRLILPADDKTEVVYISGGFARNDTFVRLLAARLPDKRVFTSEINDASALGAAMEVYDRAFGVNMPPVYLGLKAIYGSPSSFTPGEG